MAFKTNQAIGYLMDVCNLCMSGVYSLAASSGDNMHDSLPRPSKSINKYLWSQRFQILFHNQEIIFSHMKSSFTAH